MKLTKQALEYLRSENLHDLKYYMVELDKIKENIHLPVDAKIEIKKYLVNKISMHNEITLFLNEIEEKK